jgi:hypothetical protein
MYEIDYNRFLQNVGRLPENDLINSSHDQRSGHFYESNSVVDVTKDDSNKQIISDADLFDF